MGLKLKYRSLVLVTMLLLATLLTGCDFGHTTAKSTAAVPDSQQVLRLAMDWLPTSLDPVSADYPDQTTSQIAALLYSGLLTLDQHLRPVPSDADRVQVSADGLTYTFLLRGDLRFSDGTPITAADFAYSLNRASSPCFGEYAQLVHLKDRGKLFSQDCLQVVNGFAVGGPTLIGDSILIVDPATLQLTLDQPDPAFLAQLASLEYSVVDRRLVDGSGARWWCALADQVGQGTTGMYVVQSVEFFSSAPGDQHCGGPKSLVLVRNPRYWGPTPRLREIDVTPSDHEYADYRAGKYDLVPTISSFPSDQYQQARGDSGFHQAPEAVLGYLEVNIGLPPFDDLRVRQAFALALDKPALARTVTATAHMGVIPTNHVVPPSLLGLRGTAAEPTGPDGAASLAGAPDHARTLWQSYVADRCGGDASHCPKVSIFPVAVWDCFQATQTLVAQWQSALPGVRVENSYTALNIKSDWIRINQFVSEEWVGDDPDPAGWLASILYQPSLTDSMAEALLARAEATPDPSQRTTLLQQLEQRLIDNVDVLPLFQLEAAWLAKPYVRNYDPGLWYWVAPQQWASTYIAAH